jgi:transposase
MKTMTTFIGLDVGSRSVVMAWRKDDRVGGRATFEQTPAGHAEAVRVLSKLAPTHVVMEATGIYHLDLATALAHAGLPVSVINPRCAKRFAQLKLTTTKTDAVDAALLAEYGQRLTPAPWTPPNASQLALRDLGRQVNRLTAERTRAKNRLHALGAKQSTLPLLITDEEEAIATLEQRITRLRQAALILIEASDKHHAQLKHMMAAPGIGEISAIALLAELNLLPPEMKAPQVSRHAGLDVALVQSGTSINTPSHMSKGGNIYLRSPLYMPAMSAIRLDPRVNAFYTALLGRGKKKRQAIGAVMRKYLTGLWACIRNDEDFDTAKLFSDIHFKNA